MNWGMFPKDIETAQTLADLQKKKGWPVHVASATAKNQKERVVEMARILDETLVFIGYPFDAQPDLPHRVNFCSNPGRMNPLDSRSVLSS